MPYLWLHRTAVSSCFCPDLAEISPSLWGLLDALRCSLPSKLCLHNYSIPCMTKSNCIQLLFKFMKSFATTSEAMILRFFSWHSGMESSSTPLTQSPCGQSQAFVGNWRNWTQRFCGLELTLWLHWSSTCLALALSYWEAARSKLNQLPVTGVIDLGPRLPETNWYKKIQEEKNASIIH